MSVHKRKMQNLESERSNPAATDEKPGAFGRDDSAYGSTNGGGTWPTATLPPASEKLIVNWEELPHWMQDNIFIHTGYRPENFSYVKCLKSLFYLHNEWVNIWSHLLGAIGFIILLFVTYYVVFQPLSETLRWTDIAVFYAFLAGAITCLGLSASFHTYMCHSEGANCRRQFYLSISTIQASAMWNRCDYVGI
ncbi:hemolysin-III related-domain-containing protein, partial [Jimgerdemannia flammicorona]